MVEMTALGAGALAGIALGVWRTPDELCAAAGLRRFEPRMGAAERARLAAGWNRAIGAALAWARGYIADDSHREEQA
jgi:glycerol kinase